MLRHHEFKGAYADILPSGEFAFLSPDRRSVVTHLGVIEAPEVLLFTRITTTPDFQIAAKANFSNSTWVYRNGKWSDSFPISSGVQGHAFDDQGVLHTITPHADQESMGLRYYDPSAPSQIANLDILHQTPGFVTGSPTINPVTPLSKYYGVQHLYEWTRCGDVFIGQGDNGGTVIQYRGEHYLLESGDSRFVQAHRVGDTFAVAITKLEGGTIVLLWFDLADILLLPIYTAVPPIAKFNHSVLVIPFKDPRGESGALAEIVVNQDNQTVVRPYFLAGSGGHYIGTLLGVYTEGNVIALPSDVRRVYCHDSFSDPVIPQGLRSWDQYWLELYRDPTKTLVQDVARWRAQMQRLLAIWSGDIGVVAMFYCQGGAPPHEVWSVGDVLDALVRSVEIVNMDARIKVVACFEWDRANGIIAHPELRQMFDQYRIATPGIPTFRQPPKPPDPKPPEPPKTPFPSATVFKGSIRMKQYLTLKGKFIGVSPTPVPGRSGDAAYPVYADRPAGGAWEETEIRQEGASFHVRFVAANRALTLTPEGALQSRVAGTTGPWESFLATTQPEGGNLLYRREGDMVQPVLTIVEQP